jgi:hypothetical protein
MLDDSLAYADGSWLAPAPSAPPWRECRGVQGRSHMDFQLHLNCHRRKADPPALRWQPLHAAASRTFDAARVLPRQSTRISSPLSATRFPRSTTSICSARSRPRDVLEPVEKHYNRAVPRRSSGSDARTRRAASAHRGHLAPHLLSLRAARTVDSTTPVPSAGSSTATVPNTFSSSTLAPGSTRSRSPRSTSLRSAVCTPTTGFARPCCISSTIRWRDFAACSFFDRFRPRTRTAAARQPRAIFSGIRFISATSLCGTWCAVANACTISTSSS